MIEMLPTVRTVLLVSAALQLLAATVLFGLIWRTAWLPLLQRSQKEGMPFPAILLSRRVAQGLSIAMALPLLALWWFLGTPEGLALLQSLGESGAAAAPRP